MSAGTPGPKPARQAFCPQCNVAMGLMDAKCPRCGYDFPMTDPSAHLMSLWSWLVLVAVVFVACYYGFYGWLELAVSIGGLAYILFDVARRWNRYRNSSEE